MTQPENPAAWMTSAIKTFVLESPENTLQNSMNDKAWAEPIVGFSSAADPLYQKYKEVVGPFHWTPLEAFSLAFPGVQVAPEELTVISWILPQTEATKADNRKETFKPAERWARSRIFGEEVNDKLRRHVVQVLRESGYDAVAPMLSPQWEWRESEKYGFASLWSERHAAHAGGLGTFGLCDGLITPVGKAMRTGSVVARIQIPPTPRPYTDHHEYCLFYVNGTCGECIERCPAGAISEAGHDKVKCRQYVLATTKYVKETFDFDGYGCGLCQTGVVCESGIPGE